MNPADELYQEAIKQMAAAAHGSGSLERADGEARRSNPLCGDRVRIQVKLGGGRITALAHETRGCLLCRASASMLGARANGLDRAGADAARAALERVLQGEQPGPEGWPEMAMFAPARDFPSRHRCALLPFSSLEAAFEAAGEDHDQR